MARIHPAGTAESTPRGSERGASFRHPTPARSPSAASSLTSSGSSDKENRQRGRVIHESIQLAAKRPRVNKLDRPRISDTQVSRMESNPDLQYYDPNQDIEERRGVRKAFRDLNRQTSDLRQEWMAPGSTGLQDVIIRADTLYKSVRQTSDATIDSRLLVTVGDLTYKKTQQIVLGEGAQGIDVDDFVSKCISFMNRGTESTLTETGTQRRRRQNNVEESDGEEGDLESGNALNWECFGTRACFPSNLRPPVPGFLLGPLSVQKRSRTLRQRRERLQRQGLADAVRPAELGAEDLQQAENATLTHLCRNIQRHLEGMLDAGQRRCQEEFNEGMNEQEIQELQYKYNLSDDGGISLFRFTFNPQSFGQTIENLFYVSFLIREGHVGVSADSNGMPTLHSGKSTHEGTHSPHERDELHQGVFSLDFETWQQMVEVLNIHQSLIPDRTAERLSTQGPSRGWYT